MDLLYSIMSVPWPNSMSLEYFWRYQSPQNRFLPLDVFKGSIMSNIPGAKNYAILSIQQKYYI